MIAYIIELNDLNYESIINTNRLVLVDIHAPWCKPCEIISPIVDEISVDFQGHLTVGKLNADLSSEVMSKINIRNIPALLLYKDGEIVDKIIGSVPKERIVEMINSQINVSTDK